MSMKGPDKSVRIAAVRSGLEKMLGQEGADLVFKTLKLVYHMDEDEILSDPERFEGTLRRMLGVSADAIFKELSRSSGKK
jgi:hypothetical protein